jgi:hypothetical protein
MQLFLQENTAGVNFAALIFTASKNNPCALELSKPDGVLTAKPV